MLADLGVGPGDRVMSLLGRQPEQYVAALGTLKARAVFSPLFSSFGPEPIRQRLQLSGARVLVTTPALYRRKVAPVRAELPDLEHVLLVGAGQDGVGEGPASTSPGTRRGVPGLHDPADRPRGPGAAALHQRHHRARRRERVHVHEAVAAHHATSEYALGPPRRATCSGAPPTPAG